VTAPQPDRNATMLPKGILNVARPPLFPTGRIAAGPRPPVWRYRAWREWQPTVAAPPEPSMPPLAYSYAGTLDDGTMVYRFDEGSALPVPGEEAAAWKD